MCRLYARLTQCSFDSIFSTREDMLMCYNHIANFMAKSRLGELLDRAGMTREELAERLNVSVKTVAAIEKGDYDPPLSFAYKLAAELKIPVERLFSD